MSIYCCILFTEFINVREGRQRAHCVERRRERGGRRDGKIDGVPEINVMGKGPAMGCGDR